MAISGETAFEPPRTVRIVKRLNIRSHPSISAERVGRLEPAQQLGVDALVQGEMYFERASWYRIAGTGKYFWSGGAALLEPVPVRRADNDRALAVHRRVNGTVKPLSVEEIKQLYGEFEFVPVGQTGAIEIITYGWKDVFREIDHPVLRAVKRNPPLVHHLAYPYLMRVLEAISADAKLAALILTFDGSFVPDIRTGIPPVENSVRILGELHWTSTPALTVLGANRRCRGKLVACASLYLYSMRKDLHGGGISPQMSTACILNLRCLILNGELLKCSGGIDELHYRWQR